MQTERALYVFIGPITKHSFIEYMKSAIELAAKKLSEEDPEKEITKSFFVKISNAKSEDKKVSHVWIDCPQIANLLTGEKISVKGVSKFVDLQLPLMKFDNSSYKIEFQSLELSKGDDGYVTNMLTSNYKVQGLNVRDIERAFKRFAVSGDLKVQIRQGFATLEFKKDSTDASFALNFSMGMQINQKFVRFSYVEQR